MTGFLDSYEPVEERLRRFWDAHPAGRVVTAIIEHDDGHCVVKAEVWRDIIEGQAAATGYASEVKTARGVNATSMLENCETSAIGRALANLGFAPKGSRPSREEMTKAQRSAPPAEPEDTGGYATRDEWVAAVKTLRADITKAAANDSTLVDWIRDQGFPSPWPSAVCDAIRARMADTEPF